MPIADLIKIPPVQAFLMDGSVMSVFENILQKFALPIDRAEELLDLTDAVLDETLTVDQFPAILAEAFGIDIERAQRVSSDVVGFRLLPLEEYVPGVAEQIVAWGGDLNKYPKSKVGKMKMNAETFASQLDEKLNLNFSEVLIKRCAYLLYTYWTGEKTKESTLTFFSRAQTIGGLGLAPDVAQELLLTIDESRDTIDLIGGGEPGAVGDRKLGVGDTVNSGEIAIKEIEEMERTAEETREVIAEPVLHESASSESVISDSKTIEISPSHEITSELPIINKPEPIMSVPIESEKTARRLSADLSDVEKMTEDAVAMACDSVRHVFEPRGIAPEVFADIVRKAVKGVRDITQTHSVLTKDLHIEGADLDAANAAIEAAYNAVHALAPRTVMPPTPYEGARRAAAGEESGGKGEVKTEEVLDKRFSAIAKDSSSEHIVPMMPGSRVSLARSAEEEAAQQIAAIPEEKLVEAAIASRPAPISPMLTVGSMPPQKNIAPMTDIQPVRHLMGPIDELGAMTPVEFRRLSSVPADAAQKIEDMLATIETQSYEERVKGIKAWRQSPMNQLYVAMTSAALAQSIGLAEVATKRRSAGEESLSPAEIRAISALNERLRF